MDCIMRLPELNCLKPNEQTTFMKLVEEIAECNTAIEELRDYENKHNTNCLLLSDSEIKRIRDGYKKLLNDVMGEIMDIAQVCASQLFVFERKTIDIQEIFDKYVKNNKCVDEEHTIFDTKNKCRYIHFVATSNSSTLEKTMNQIILSMGTIAQLGKFTGENGETPVISKEESIEKYVFQLFEIIQHCFNLLYSMEEKYSINIWDLFDSHIKKLIKKGYYSE